MCESARIFHDACPQSSSDKGTDVAVVRSLLLVNARAAFRVEWIAETAGLSEDRVRAALAVLDGHHGIRPIDDMWWARPTPAA